MTSREEPQLFDLPLVPEPPRKRQRKARAIPEQPEQREPEQVELPFEVGESDSPPEHDPEQVLGEEQDGYEGYPGEEEDEEYEESLFLDRVFAGLADGGVHFAILIAVTAGMQSFGIVPGWHHAPALLVFLLCFSFVYSVVPLAFWGQTPGMAWRELRSSGSGDLPLTATQAILRWVGGLLTPLLAGLPILLLFTDRSLADRLSASHTDFAEGAFFRG